jgi:hypothetical protein
MRILRGFITFACFWRAGWLAGFGWWDVHKMAPWLDKQDFEEDGMGVTGALGSDAGLLFLFLTLFFSRSCMTGFDGFSALCICRRDEYGLRRPWEGSGATHGLVSCLRIAFQGSIISEECIFMFFLLPHFVS